MSKQVIHTLKGEDIVVREDAAKSFRGVYWALISFGLILLVAALMFFGGFLSIR